MNSIYLVVTPFFPSPGNWRGAYCYDFVNALMRTGRYDVRVFLPGNGEDYDYQGVHVYRFHPSSLPSGLCPWFVAGRNRRSFLQKVRQVGIDLKDVAVCHGHTIACAIFPVAVKQRNQNCLTLLHHHCSGSFRLNAGRFGWIPGYTDWSYHWQRKYCNAIDCHVFCSRKSWETYGRYCPDGPESVWHDVRKSCVLGRLHRSLSVRRGLVFYNGFDPRQFYPAPVKHEGFVIGCIANFQPLKGHLLLLEAVAKLVTRIPKIRLRLVGSGETLPACRAFVVAHQLDSVVTFETEVDHAQLPAFYNSIDLFVLPSRMEGFCCVYMEAAGCGVPYIGCRGVSCEEVLSAEEQDTWLVIPNDVESLAEKILQYYCVRRPQPLIRKMDYDSLVGRFVREVDGEK